MMKKAMILSGAGLSAESGIRTFRDNDGLWEEYDVMKVCSVQGWEEDRKLVTQFYNDRRKDLADKKPNPAHFALARLEKRFPGQIWNLTQNVDDLLERAGCENVIHLHGTLRDLRCEACGHVWDIGFRAQREDESCPSCGGRNVRHNVVMFGEPAPAYRFIQKAIDESDLFVAIGTSGQVIDIVSIATEFANSILVNPNREMYVTMFGSHERYIDEYFETYIRKKAGEAAAELEERIARFLK
ncbi:SIR2 family NAD-dependent protein deacylase [Hydrogenimonas cancrithermarum]|uniref:protein acetyllysine N-acetyltransferase n=1 Tax=Hydrogenimonas cancrithermarum TaxID=2993563 RepID=A0ABM8FJ97_9BACT|nr:Sir2 family NAD-dependent protein deacetylase [Hydrogenimonas cancrithermarum]BDY12354.1 NAD-dependent protein deacylase [Hydrogenimonas cancrithermarum]